MQMVLKKTTNVAHPRRARILLLHTIALLAFGLWLSGRISKELRLSGKYSGSLADTNRTVLVALAGASSRLSHDTRRTALCSTRGKQRQKQTFELYKRNMLDPLSEAGFRVEVIILTNDCPQDQWSQEIMSMLTPYTPTTLMILPHVCFAVGPDLELSNAVTDARVLSRVCGKLFNASGKMLHLLRYIHSSLRFDHVVVSRFDLQWRRKLVVNQFVRSATVFPFRCERSTAKWECVADTFISMPAGDFHIFVEHCLGTTGCYGELENPFQDAEQIRNYKTKHAQLSYLHPLLWQTGHGCAYCLRRVHHSSKMTSVHVKYMEHAYINVNARVEQNPLYSFS